MSIVNIVKSLPHNLPILFVKLFRLSQRQAFKFSQAARRPADDRHAVQRFLPCLLILLRDVRPWQPTLSGLPCATAGFSVRGSSCITMNAVCMMPAGGAATLAFLRTCSSVFGYGLALWGRLERPDEDPRIASYKKFVVGSLGRNDAHGIHLMPVCLFQISRMGPVICPLLEVIGSILRLLLSKQKKTRTEDTIPRYRLRVLIVRTLSSRTGSFGSSSDATGSSWKVIRAPDSSSICTKMLMYTIAREI